MDSGLFGLMGQGTLETLYMVLGSTALAYIVGLPLGLLLVATDDGGVWQVRWLNRTLGVIVNILRSVPFAILIVFIAPFTRAIVGTTIGSTAVIVPLFVGAFPFVARMVENSAKEVDRGVIEAAQAMGASPLQILTKVILPEAKPSLLGGLSITIVTIIGYSAMAGFVGAGGLGSIAVNYGYYRYQDDIMMVTLLVIVVLVQIIQEIGLRASSRFDKRKN